MHILRPKAGRHDSAKRNERQSLLTRLKLTYMIFLLLFAGLSFFIIVQMTHIAELNELTYRHPFAVSNAVLRIQVNVEKINVLMFNITALEKKNVSEIRADISILDLKIEEDFSIINRRFLGDKARFNNAYKEYQKWKQARDSIVFDTGPADDRVLRSSVRENFIREMDYLSGFAANKAAEFLNTSKMNAKTSITLAYILVSSFLALGFIMILNLVESIKNPMNVLMHVVQDIHAGNFNQKVYILSGGREFVQLADAFNSMTSRLNSIYADLEAKVAERTETLEDTLEERNILLRELYHRTKNNMQVISSIVSMKAEGVHDSESYPILKELENKIQAMALVHQMLYKSDDLSHIFFDDYIRELIKLIMNSFDKTELEIQNNICVQHLPLIIDLAIPCGLMLNELITNSIKYAFPGGVDGVITISASRKDKGVIVIDYHDNGVGLPDGFSLEETQTMGFLLIRTIAEHQLNGVINLSGSDGISCHIEFPDTAYRKRI